MMLIDFFIYGSLGLTFFFAILGTGLFCLDRIQYKEPNLFLQIGIAFFISLALYTFFIVLALFIFPSKKITLIGTTLVYSVFSFALLYFQYKKKLLTNYFFKKQYLLILSLFLFVFSIFFLQVYKNALLDEWLHRPIVSTFVQTGDFPLLNPLSPYSNYIESYHYGSQIGAAAIALIFFQESQVALDIYKISVIIATVSLLLGVFLQWSNNNVKMAIGATLLAFFGASSFFLIDAFTSSHLFNVKLLDLENAHSRPMNYPLSYSLTGLTWVNVPLTLASLLFFQKIFLQHTGRRNFFFYLITSSFFTGFFLISEFFASITLIVILAVIFLRQLLEKIFSWKEIALIVSTLLTSIILVAFLGTPMGKILKSVPQYFESVFLSENQVSESSMESVVPAQPSPGILSLRSVSNWGYPGEKKPYRIWDSPFYYLRSIGFELFALVLILVTSVARKRIWNEQPMLLAGILFGLTVPFAFSTSFGDLNLAKATEVSLIFIKILLLAFLLFVPFQRWLKYVLIGFLIMGAISPVLMGFNIQWQWISSKGKSQFCAQNPECYKGDIVILLKDFKNATGGKKNILTSTSMSEKQKVVDITSSQTFEYTADFTSNADFKSNKIDYILDTENLREEMRIEVMRVIDSYPVAFQKGEKVLRKVE